MKVGEWIAAHPGSAVTVGPDDPLEAVIDTLVGQPCLRDVYVVSDEARVIGHLAHDRLIRMVLAEHRPSRTRRQLMEHVAGGTARELMNADFVYASPDEELDDVLHRQVDHHVEDMPVLDAEGRLLGAVNLTAVLRETRRQEREGGEEP